MITAFAAVILAAAVADAHAPAMPVRQPTEPPHARGVIEAQFAAPRPSAPAGISGAEADRLYALYLGRIGQAPADAGQRDAYAQPANATAGVPQ